MKPQTAKGRGKAGQEAKGSARRLPPGLVLGGGDALASLFVAVVTILAGCHIGDVHLASPEEVAPAADGAVEAAASSSCVGQGQRLLADDGFLIEDFESARHDDADVCLLNDVSQANPNLLAACSACFNYCDRSCPDFNAGMIETSLTKSAEEALWCSGRSLVLTYDVRDSPDKPARSGRFAGYVVRLAGNATCPCASGAAGVGGSLCDGVPQVSCPGFDADALKLNYLTFWMRFESLEASPDVEVAIKDDCLEQTRLKPRAVSNGFVEKEAGGWSKVRMSLERLRQNGIRTDRLQEMSFTFTQGAGYAEAGRMFLDDIAFER